MQIYTICWYLYVCVMHDIHVHTLICFTEVAYIFYGFAVWLVDDIWWVLFYLLLFVDDVPIMIICVWQYWLGWVDYGMEFWLVMMLQCGDL